MRKTLLLLGLPIVVGVGVHLALTSHSVNASSNPDVIGFAMRKAVTVDGSQPTPGSPSYAWWQFASFLKSQVQSGVIGPAGFPVPAHYDSDWSGPWLNKGQLGLSTPPCGLGSSARPVPFDTSALEYPVQLRVQIQRHSYGVTRVPVDQNCQGIQQVVLYNATASSIIHNQSLNLLPSLQKLLLSGTNIHFDDGSIIIKELWEPITRGRTQISVWQPNAEFFSHPALPDTFGDITSWPKIRVDVAAPPDVYIPTVSAPLASFAHTGIGASGASVAAYVLVGVNMAHRVNGTWYWFQFSWADAAIGKTSDQSQCASSWHQYCVNMTQDLAGAATCFNPYLEGQQPNGLYSNCVRCHQFAAFPRQEVDGISAVNGSSPTAVSQAHLQQYMNGAISTDSLWSLITHLPGQ